MLTRIRRVESRTREQLQQHYLVEKELAARLRNASKEERRGLYTALYDELYRRVPLHPQLTQKADAQAQATAVAGQIRLLQRFLKPQTVFLEVAPGDCALSFAVAKMVKHVYGVDVSEEITKAANVPENFELIISDGTSIPVPDNSIDVAYSNQLMEHLHPDDALEQVQNIYRALKPGGVYVCITPTRFTGPHDVSKYFDQVATGFHLKEYIVSELATMYKNAGFSKVQGLVGARGYYLLASAGPITWIESALVRQSASLQKKLAGHAPLKWILGIRLVATK